MGGETDPGTAGGVEPPSRPAGMDRTDDGVDVTLIRWMLSLTPAQRLDVLQRHVNAVLEIRGSALGRETTVPPINHRGPPASLRHRMQDYLRSGWVRAGLGLLVLGSGPLLAIILLAGLGLWPDPNPNPVGPGLLFFFTFWPSIICLVIGVVRVRRGRGRAGVGGPE